jgi:hypothetical protein
MYVLSHLKRLLMAGSFPVRERSFCASVNYILLFRTASVKLFALRFGLPAARGKEII